MYMLILTFCGATNFSTSLFIECFLHLKETQYQHDFLCLEGFKREKRFCVLFQFIYCRTFCLYLKKMIVFLILPAIQGALNRINVQDISKCQEFELLCNNTSTVSCPSEFWGAVKVRGICEGLCLDCKGNVIHYNGTGPVYQAPGGVYCWPTVGTKCNTVCGNYNMTGFTHCRDNPDPKDEHQLGAATCNCESNSTLYFPKQDELRLPLSTVKYPKRSNSFKNEGNFWWILAILLCTT
jgi:hypothetical protein